MIEKHKHMLVYATWEATEEAASQVGQAFPYDTYFVLGNHEGKLFCLYARTYGSLSDEQIASVFAATTPTYYAFNVRAQDEGEDNGAHLLKKCERNPQQ